MDDSLSNQLVYGVLAESIRGVGVIPPNSEEKIEIIQHPESADKLF